MTKSTKSLFYVMLYCFILFSLAPLLRASLPMDTQEAIVWGKYCLWGTTKHPPFSGWLAYNFYRLPSSWDGAMYILSQLCVACGIFYIYKLSRCFFAENKAVMAAMLQFGIIYYHYSAVEFNVNVLSVALWPMCAYYFWQAYTENRLKDWLLFGVLTGINLLNKYVSALLIVSLALFVPADKKLWTLLKNGKAYLAAATALAIVAPHLWWLWQNDFETFNYFASRSGNNAAALWGHFVYPLKFLGAQILFAGAALLTYFCFYFKREKEPRNTDKTVARFMAITALAPACLFTATALISGNALKSMWGFPCLFMWGAALVYFFPLKPSADLLKKMSWIFAGWISLFSIAYSVQCLLTTSQRFATDVHGFAAEMSQKWQQHTTRPLKYVSANVWYADIMALYAPEEVRPMVWGKPKSNPWFDAKDFARHGALLIAADEYEYNQYRQLYGEAVSAPQKMTVEFKNYFGKTKAREVWYGFYLPKEEENVR